MSTFSPLPPRTTLTFLKVTSPRLSVKKQHLVLLAVAGVAGWYLFVRKKSPAESNSSGMPSGVEGLVDAVGSALNIGQPLGAAGALSGLAGEAINSGIKNMASGIANVQTQTQTALGQVIPNIQGAVTPVQQNISSGAAQATLFASGVPYVAQTFPGASGIISISPSANTPPTALNSVAQSIEKAAVSTGFGNFQTSSGAVQYIPPTVSTNVSALIKSGSYTAPSVKNTPSSNAIASLLATGRIG